MAAKQPILRRDASLFEAVKLADGRLVIALTTEGFSFFEAILKRIEALEP